MLLKTRKAIPKYRLFRKFKVDFFDFFSKSARISRKYLRFYIRRKRRYIFWATRQLKTYRFSNYLAYRFRRLLRLKPLRIFKQFSLFKGKFKRKYAFFVRKFINSIVISNGIRFYLAEKAVLNCTQHKKYSTTPTNYRFDFLYNLKNK